MHRRDILKRGVSLAAAGGVLGSAELTTAQPTLPAAALASGSTTEYITRPDGGHLFTRDWGTGSPIVFLAAWALPSDMWMYQMLPLCEGGRRCIAYDRRGHGRSSEGRSRLDFDVLADDLASVLETLDLHEVTLVGMSMASGEIVRYFTRHGSRRVARAIFVSPAATPFPLRTADNPGGIPQAFFDDWRQTIQRDYPKWLDDNRAAFFVANTSPHMQDWVKTLMLGNSLRTLVECTRVMTTTDFRRELSQVRVPSLVIHGDKDASAPLELAGRPTANLIPGARLQVYEGGPHGLFVTHMDRLTRDILSFAPA